MKELDLCGLVIEHILIFCGPLLLYLFRFVLSRLRFSFVKSCHLSLLESLVAEKTLWNGLKTEGEMLIIYLGSSVFCFAGGFC